MARLFCLFGAGLALLCGCSVVSTTATVASSAVSVAGTVVNVGITAGSAVVGAAGSAF